MTNAEAERLKAQMNMENIDMSGAQAVPQEEIDKQWRDHAHELLNIARQIYCEPRVVDIKPKKKWWQWWKK